MLSHLKTRKCRNYVSYVFSLCIFRVAAFHSPSLSSLSCGSSGKKKYNNILICCCCCAADICSPVHVSWCWFPRECGAPYLFLNALLHPSIRWRTQEFRLQWGGKAEPVVKVEEKQDIFLGQEVHAIKLVRENKLDFMSSRSISSWGCD